MLQQVQTGGHFIVTVNNLHDKFRPVPWSCIIHERTGLFFMTMLLIQTQSVMYLSPRVHFYGTWLFASLLLLFSGLQNVLPRLYFYNSLSEGLKLLYTTKISL